MRVVYYTIVSQDFAICFRKMEDTDFESQRVSPTALDNTKNRFREFVGFATAHFNIRTATEILISMDKNNAQSGKCAKYLGKIADATITAGGFIGGLGPMAKGIGTASGEIVKEIVSEVEKNKKHKSAKLIEHHFTGFDPESEKWIQFVLEVFTNIFVQ